MTQPVSASSRAAMVALLSLFAPALSAAPGLAPAAPPNIVLIVADDLGYGDLGCYGSEVSKTPHIDALAERGMRFTDFHSGGAMCSPTRASILTGRYPQRFGEIFDGALSAQTMGHLGLPPEAVTIAERLREGGYATACVGKWHLGYEPPFLPNDQGFDLFRGLHSGDGDFHTRVDRSGNEDWWHDTEIVMESGYTTDLITRHGVEFIEASRDRPFFLYLAHLAIHFPWQGPEDPPHRVAGKPYHKDKWGIVPNPENVEPHVVGMIESMDASVGAVIEALERNGLESNTLVVFTSDNGGYLTYGSRFRNISSNGPFRGQKVDLYEGGHRVPLIASWPGRIPPRTVTGETAHTNDLAPTFAGLADADFPVPDSDGVASDGVAFDGVAFDGVAFDGVASDGVDLAPLLFEGGKLAGRNLYWRTRSQRAVRSGPWKLVADRKGSSPELYHLGNDPGEENNLSSLHPDRTQELNRAWETWNARMEKSAAKFPDPDTPPRP